MNLLLGESCSHSTWICNTMWSRATLSLPTHSWLILSFSFRRMGSTRLLFPFGYNRMVTWLWYVMVTIPRKGVAWPPKLDAGVSPAAQVQLVGPAFLIWRAAYLTLPFGPQTAPATMRWKPCGINIRIPVIFHKDPSSQQGWYPVVNWSLNHSIESSAIFCEISAAEVAEHSAGVSDLAMGMAMDQSEATIAGETTGGSDLW